MLLLTLINVNSPKNQASLKSDLENLPLNSDEAGLDLIVIWDTPWGGSSLDYGYGVAVDGTGAIYCVGYTNSFGAGGSDLVLLKFFLNGTKAWQTTWGGPNSDYGYGVAVDGTGAIYCVGSTNSFGAGGVDLLLVKFNANGTKVWNTTWGGPNSDGGYGVAVDATGAIYCVGYSNSFGAGGGDLVLLKVFSNGTKAWQTTWGDPSYECGYDVAVDATGAIYCTGYTNSFGAGGPDLVLVKFLSDGTKAWQTTWGGSSTEYGYGVAVDATGAIYCVGYTSSFGAGGSDLVLLKFFSNGTKAWQTIWGGPNSDWGYGVTMDATGAIYCVGYTNSFGAGTYDLLLIKFFSNGTKSQQTTWGGSNTDYGRDIAVDATGAIYCVGCTLSIGMGNYDLVLIKFNQPTASLNKPLLEQITPNPDSDGVIELNWNDVADASIYYIYRSYSNITSVSGMISIATVTQSTYQDDIISNGTYFYAIVAVDSVGLKASISNCEAVKVLISPYPLSLWNNIWGGLKSDGGYGVAVDATGAIYCVGSTNSFGVGGVDLLLVKFNANGIKVWNTTWGGPNSDGGYGVAVDATGAIYCVGYTYSFGAGGSDLVLLRFFSNGTKAWQTTWGGPNTEYGYGVVVDATGAIYCVGYTNSFGAGNYDLVLVKFFSDGTKAWQTTWGGLSTEYGYGVAVDATGAVYCIGYTNSFGVGGGDLVLLKFFSNGTKAWQTTWGGPSNDCGYGVAVDATRAIYCIGFTNSFGAGGGDLVLLKFFSNGTKAWQTTWGGPSTDYGRGVVVDETRAIYCIGYTSCSGAGGYDLVLLRFFSNGTRSQQTTWGGSSTDYGYGVAVDATGAIYCVGHTYSFGAGGSDLVLVKFYQPIISLNKSIIVINNDNEFLNEKGVRNPTAAGSRTDPYIISFWEINGGGSDEICITIKNTRKFFEINNCTLFNATIGIQLLNVTNAKITNNRIFNIHGVNGTNGIGVANGANGSKGIGIMILNCTQISISNNYISNIFGGKGGIGSAGGAGSTGTNGIPGTDSKWAANGTSGGDVCGTKGAMGGSGGFSSGLFLEDSINVTASWNSILNIFGGQGGMGGAGGAGGNGGAGGAGGSGTWGGDGGRGGHANGGPGGRGGTGGEASGLYIKSSINIKILWSNILNLSGGRGGAGGAGGNGGRGGTGGIGGIGTWGGNGGSGGFANGGNGGMSGTGGYASGVYFDASKSLENSWNTISKSIGGQGGAGGKGGNGGIGGSGGEGAKGVSGWGGDGGRGGDACGGIGGTAMAGGYITGFYFKDSIAIQNSRNNISELVKGEGGIGGICGYGGRCGYGGNGGTGIFYGITGKPGVQSNGINGINGINNSVYGFTLKNANYSLTYLNFIYCQKNEDNGTDNRWDNEIIGNYWIAYSGVDNDNNGIGDTPYFIPGTANSQDNFPISIKIQNSPPLRIPTLKNGTVNPLSGNQCTLFNFSVIYMDENNKMPVYVNTLINGTLYPMVKSNSTDSNYVDGCLYQYQTNLLPGKYLHSFECSNGDKSNSTPLYINLIVTHANLNAPEFDRRYAIVYWGSTSSRWDIHAIYKDLDNDAPTYVNVTINGTSYRMNKFTPSDLNYMDGCEYFYSIYLTRGNYIFVFECSDGQYRNSTKPFKYYPPILSNYTVSPSIGFPFTQFTFITCYTSLTNYTPQYTTLIINGTRYSMTKQNSSDLNYMDGCIYRYQTTLPNGTYLYSFECSDGIYITSTGSFQLRVVNPFNPPSLNSITPNPDSDGLITLSWSTVLGADKYYLYRSPTLITSVIGMRPIGRVNLPTFVDTLTSNGTYYYVVVAGSSTQNSSISNCASIRVAIPPVNSFAPTLYSGGIKPLIGTQFTNFTFTVMYRDQDNNPPVFMNMKINGISFAMRKQDPSDYSYTDGCLFQYIIRLPPGLYNYSFICYDGKFFNQPALTYLGLIIYDAAIASITNFTLVNPLTTVQDTTPDIICQISVRGAGINLSSVQYAYSTVGGAAPTNWTPVNGIYLDAACTISAHNGSTGILYLKVNSVQFNQYSSTNNIIFFRAADMTGTQVIQSSPITIQIERKLPSATWIIFSFIIVGAVVLGMYSSYIVIGNRKKEQRIQGILIRIKSIPDPLPLFCQSIEEFSDFSNNLDAIPEFSPVNDSFNALEYVPEEPVQSDEPIKASPRAIQSPLTYLKLYKIFYRILKAFPSLHQYCPDADLLNFLKELKSLSDEEIFAYISTLLEKVSINELRTQISVLMNELEASEEYKDWNLILQKIDALIYLGESLNDKNLLKDLLQLLIFIKDSSDGQITIYRESQIQFHVQTPVEIPEEITIDTPEQISEEILEPFSAEPQIAQQCEDPLDPPIEVPVESFDRNCLENLPDSEILFQLSVALNKLKESNENIYQIFLYNKIGHLIDMAIALNDRKFLTDLSQLLILIKNN